VRTFPQLKRLNYLFAQTDSAYHEAARRLGLSDSALAVLYTLCVEGGSCQLGEIISQNSMSKQTLNSALRSLERERLIQLEADDGRKKRVSLTQQGYTRCEKTVVRLIEIENRIFDAWEMQEQEMYAALMQKYLNMLRREIEVL